MSPGTDSQFAGTWAQRSAAAGTSFVLTLQVDGTNVAGSGTYAIEGGQPGNLTVKGTISGDTLKLDITYGSNQAQFSGEIASAKEMSGSLHLGPRDSLTPSAIVTFDRKE